MDVKYNVKGPSGNLSVAKTAPYFTLDRAKLPKLYCIFLGVAFLSDH